MTLVKRNGEWVNLYATPNPALHGNSRHDVDLVKVTGDTMTGSLAIDQSGVRPFLDPPTESTDPSGYPDGRTFSFTSSSTESWSHGYGTIETITSGARSVQLFHPKAGDPLGPTHIRYLADGTNDTWGPWYALVLGDTGYTYEPALDNSWTWHSWGGGYQRVGNLVTLQMMVDGSGATSDVVFTLPDGYKPNRNVMGIGFNSSGNFHRFDIRTDGRVRVENRDTWNAVDTCFPTDDAFPT